MYILGCDNMESHQLSPAVSPGTAYGPLFYTETYLEQNFGKGALTMEAAVKLN
jgi:hypothetical protein